MTQDRPGIPLLDFYQRTGRMTKEEVYRQAWDRMVHTSPRNSPALWLEPGMRVLDFGCGSAAESILSINFEARADAIRAGVLRPHLRNGQGPRACLLPAFVEWERRSGLMYF